jgi:hypothetical protein
MNLKSQTRGLLALLALALAVLACGGGGAAATATREPRPTQRPQATATTVEDEPTDAPEPTDEPAPTDDVAPTDEPAPTEDTSETSITLAAEPYTHSSGAFTITLPDGWDDVQDLESSIFVAAPDDTASIEVSYTYVSEPLDEDGLNTFIQAVEDNWFATYAAYEAFEPQPQSDGSIGVLKTLELEDGTPKTVFSYYWQEGQVVYEQDFWVDTDLYDAYLPGLLDVANSMTTDPAAAEGAVPYGVTYTFTGPNDLFTISVPYAWTYEQSEAENSLVDVFTSPDGHTYVENITYDDGQEISKSEAGAFARFLLQDYYQLTDIKITDDQVQSDGSERLNWYSPSQGIDGTSFFETRGTTFLLLTWVVESDLYEQYFPVWESLVGSYDIPEPES